MDLTWRHVQRMQDNLGRARQDQRSFPYVNSSDSSADSTFHFVDSPEHPKYRRANSKVNPPAPTEPLGEWVIGKFGVNRRAQEAF